MEEPPPDESVGNMLLGTTTGLIFFVILTTSLRVYIRASNRALAWDDHLMVLASLFSVVRWAIQVVQVVKYGQGRHRIYVSEENYTTNNRLGWWAQLFLFVGLATVKISIMLLILRIKNTKALKWVLYTAMVGVVVSNLAVIVVVLAECRPVGYWRADAVCWPTYVRIYTIYVTIAYTILTDFLCSLLPLAVVWKIRMPRTTKVMVCGLMSLGLLATGFGIARAIELSLEADDISWTYAKSAFWANLEFYLGIIAGNLAISYQVYRHFFPARRGQKRAPAPGRTWDFTDPDSAQGFARKLRDPAGDLGLREDTCVGSSNRRSSWGSAESGILMKTRIRKKTELWVTECSREERGEGAGSRERNGTEGWFSG